jgi:hypothetical protein
MNKTSTRKNGSTTQNRVESGVRGGLSLNALFAQNIMLERKLWLRRQLDPRRDIDAECGHPECVTIQDYKRLFLRGDIASRVVSVLPEESWKENPDVFETEDQTETDFEKAWIDLDKKFQLFAALERLDILSGIGRFGILLLGIDDGLKLNEPVASINEKGEPVGAPGERKLLYVRAFDEELVNISKLETDVTNPRFGMPVTYQIRFEDANPLTSIGATPQQSSPTSFENLVHWSRVIHVVDNRTTSNVYGLPRMEKVLNRLLDIRKIAGGSGEMFWKGGFPGLSLEAMLGQDTNVVVDMAAVKEDMDRYMNGLQRYIATVGMQAKSLGVQVADPSPHIDGQIKLIAMALGVPWRIFVGSEAAQLASEQDSRAWNGRVDRRRNKYITPYIITPTVERLVAFGVLPEPTELNVSWPDLNSLSDLDKSTVANNQTNAIAKYVQSGSDLLVDPFHFLTLIIGMEDDEANSILDQVGDRLVQTDPNSIGQVPPPPPGQPGQPAKPGQPPPAPTRKPPGQPAPARSRRPTSSRGGNPARNIT